MPVTIVAKKSKPKIIHVADDVVSIDSPLLDQNRSRLAKASMTPLEYIRLDELKPNPRGVKKHPERQIALIAETMTQFGCTQALAIDKNNVIVLGNGRYEAARRAKLEYVPAIRLLHLSSIQKRALAIADNKLSEIGEWDNSILAEELQFLCDPVLDLSFDMQILGFETVEIDNILEAAKPRNNSASPDDTLPDIPQYAVSARGDIWIMEGHRLLCGDARNANDYRSLMGNDVADIVFTDPPYNVPNAGHVTSRRNVREFAMAAGEMSYAEYSGFLRECFSAIAKHIRPGAVVFPCMDWRHLSELRNACDPIFGPPRNMIVWVKSNAGMGTFYRSQHEFIVPYVLPGARPINNFGLGGKGRYRTNVWQYPGANAFGHKRDEELAMHPTVKPVALVADALKDCSNRRDIVLDPFGGSGTTMIAAERTGRSARLIEYDALYCDVIVQRWQSATGKEAHIAETNETFDQVKARRISAARV
jgi:DNA modification methylase